MSWGLGQYVLFVAVGGPMTGVLHELIHKLQTTLHCICADGTTALMAHSV